MSEPSTSLTCRSRGTSVRSTSLRSATRSPSKREAMSEMGRPTSLSMRLKTRVAASVNRLTWRWLSTNSVGICVLCSRFWRSLFATSSSSTFLFSSELMVSSSSLTDCSSSLDVCSSSLADCSSSLVESSSSFEDFSSSFEVSTSSTVACRCSLVMRSSLSSWCRTVSPAMAADSGDASLADRGAPTS